MESIALMIFIISFMSLSAFAIPVVYETEDNDTQGDGIVDRLSITLTMMLTSVAFRFLVADSLPKISYYTFLDKYLMYHFVYIFMLSLYFTIGPYVLSDPSEDVIACYIAVAVLFLIMIMWGAKA